MIPVDEFYQLPEAEQSDLVRKGNVVVDGAIASFIPDSKQNILVFDEPVEHRIVQTLQRGHYSIEELAEEFPLKKRVIKSVVSDFRYRPQYLLGRYQSVMRVADTEGTAYIYSVEPIPYEIRVWDPTLCCHLLEHNELIKIPEFPSDKISWTLGREKFVEQNEKYWMLSESDLPEKPYQGISFVNSTLGPIPKSIQQDKKEVRDRVRDVDGTYHRRKFDENNIKRSIAYYKSICRRNPSLAAFQSFVLYLYDLSNFIYVAGHPGYQSLLQSGIKLFFACLFGGYRVNNTTEWALFEVDRVGKLDELDSQVIDIIELQPTSNSILSERWDLPDGSAVQQRIYGELNQYATRNTDNFICATESARRYIRRLENEGAVTLSKAPPEVPNQARTVFN